MPFPAALAQPPDLPPAFPKPPPAVRPVFSPFCQNHFLRIADFPHRIAGAAGRIFSTALCLLATPNASPIPDPDKPGCFGGKRTALVRRPRFFDPPPISRRIARLPSVSSGKNGHFRLSLPAKLADCLNLLCFNAPTRLKHRPVCGNYAEGFLLCTY